MTISNYLSKARHLSQIDHDDGTLHDDLQNLIRSAEDFLESTASYSGAEIEAARARIVSQLHNAREHARQHRRSRIYQRASNIAHTSGRYVNEHKWQGAGVLIGIAALVGGIYAGRQLSGCNHRRR